MIDKPMTLDEFFARMAKLPGSSGEAARVVQEGLQRMRQEGFSPELIREYARKAVP